jgi:hypothetical protein
MFLAGVAMALMLLSACGTDASVTDEGSSTSSSAVPVSSGPLGPIAVEQVLARSADTPIAVTGRLYSQGGVVRLCGAISAARPPACGDPSVELVGLDLASVDGTTTLDGVTWKEEVVLNLAATGDGRFTVVAVVAGTRTEVTLGIFSGMPDPTWTLTVEQSNQLSALVAGLGRADGAAPVGGLGYHGFTIVGVDGTFVAFEGIVAHTSDPAYLLVDPQRSAERFLLDTARPHLAPEEIAAVNEALGGSSTP